jgi:hypothetical protein
VQGSQRGVCVIELKAYVESALVESGWHPSSSSVHCCKQANAKQWLHRSSASWPWLHSVWRPQVCVAVTHSPASAPASAPLQWVH